MPRTPEVCPALFCPFSHFSNIASRVLRIQPPVARHLSSAFCGPSASCRLSTAVQLPRYAFCLLLLLIAYHSSLITVHAQGTTATLSGNVTDQNGAVIPDVSIAVINIAQGFQRSATTNGEGTFVVPLLPPGHYTVKAEHDGFTPTEVRDVVLNVNDKVAMRIHMNVGTVSQTVQIVEGSSLINESPTVATVVDRQFVANLPLNGRSFQSLITLTPGVVLTKSTFAEAGQFSVNGQRADANYFTVDGVSANAATTAGASAGQTVGGAVPALSAAGGTNNLVSVDALQEFKVQTSTYAPEFGRSPGAQVQIITRSGTNDFHGTFFDYFRNDALDANDWFSNRVGIPKAALRQNDFGGVFSGPALLPRFGEGGHQPAYNGRNRTFFFFSYEGLRLRQPQVVVTDVPSLTARGSAVPQMKPFLNAFPIPNGPENPNGLAQFTASFSNPSTLNATSIRLDHNLGSKLNLFGRYNSAPSKTVQRAPGSFRSANTLNSTSFNTQTLTLGLTHSITAKVINELRLNYTRYAGLFFSSVDNFGGAVMPPDSLLLLPGNSRDDSSFSLVISSGKNTGLGVGIAGDNLQRQVNLVDNFSITSGTHQLKFGVDYRRLSPIFRLLKYSQSPSFSSVSLAVAGRASSVVIAAFPRETRPLLTNLSLYGQDTWKISPRLTVTYGLRWEVNPPPSEQTGNDQFAVTGLDNPSTLALASRGTRIYETTYDNFAPRIGGAYRLFQHPGRETMVRGGFGIFYDLGNGQAMSAFGNGFPYSFSKPTLTNVDFPLTAALAAPPALDLNLRPIGLIYAFSPKLKLPRIYQLNFAIEQSLGSNQTVSATYLGAIGRRLLRGELLINPNPTFARVNVTTNAATSDYHAMQLQFQRRLSKGWQALVSYTWSHSLDIASNDSTFSTPGSKLDPQLDRAASDFDMRHALSGAVSYNIPTPKVGRVGKSILGNWSVDTIFTARSATPVNIRYTRDIGFGSFSFRPDLVPGIPIYINDPSAPGGKRFNKSAFLTPVQPRQGTLGRNALRGFPIHQVDLTLRRRFDLTERMKLRFGADFFNIFNHPNFADPNGLLTSTTFGVSASMLGRSLGGGGSVGGLNPLYQVGGPRSIQVSLKFEF
jgi:Carboxypeptidase regulatory-like domain/TonB dependent receptor-like, beta-barrel